MMAPSVEYETWHLVGWLNLLWFVGLNIGCDCPVSQWIVESHSRWEFLQFCKGHWQYPCTTPTAGKCLPLGLCKETVKESNATLNPLHADLFLRKHAWKIYFNFRSCDIGMTQVVDIHPHGRQWLVYPTWSMSLLLMTWLFVWPGHHQHWPIFTGIFLPQHKKS